MNKSTSFSTILGLTIKEKREQSGKTQKNMAEALGMSVGGWNHLENGSNSITVARLFEVCKILGLDPVNVMQQLSTTVEQLEKDGWEINYTSKSESDVQDALLTGSSLSQNAAISSMLAGIIPTGVGLAAGIPGVIAAAVGAYAIFETLNKNRDKE